MFGMKGKKINKLYTALLVGLIVTACANMGNPDGGPYDDTPPVLVKSSPSLNATHYNDKKIELYFDEYVKVENASEKIIVSPPQVDPPKITTQPTKKITVTFQEDLLPNTTYSVDFSDAIVDNNEGNPFGNFAFTFSTGDVIDTLQISGHVLEAENLDPVKGIYVGVYPMQEGDSVGSDSAFFKTKLTRISRTDQKGYFSIRGLAPGTYQVVALQDADQNFLFNQKSENIAFWGKPVTPSTIQATRPDTIWTDSLTIDSIRNIGYTRYMPDDLILRAFKEDATLLYFKKAERLIPQSFQIYFSGPSPELPRLKGLNFDENNAFLLEKSLHNDTLRYWLRDTLLCNLDTLKMSIEYLYTDSTGALTLTSDTLKLSVKGAKPGYEPKKKKKKKDEDEEPEIKFLPIRINTSSRMNITDNINLVFEEPVLYFDSTAFHLEEKEPKDSIWKKKPFLIRQDTLNIRQYTILSEWDPGKDYQFTIDSTSVHSIYGTFNDKTVYTGKMRSLDDYANLFFSIQGLEGPAYVELISEKGKVLRREKVNKNKAAFYFLLPGKYYARLVNDRNDNGKWDTGLYPTLQPEEVYYYPDAIELRALWDTDQDWNIKGIKLDEQKPKELKPKETNSRTNRASERNATRRR